MNEDKTINYYNSTAEEFVSQTKSIDFGFTQKKFTDRLQKGELSEEEKYDGIWAFFDGN